MKTLITTIVMTVILIVSANADTGIVIKEDVCGSGNSIIETSDGWYVAAEHYNGVYLYVGDVVYGNMKTYGIQDITRRDGAVGSFYIEDWESNIGAAYEELCG